MKKIMEITENSNGGYNLNGRSINTISGIQSITFDEANYLVSSLNGERFTAKGHDCFLVDLSDDWGYSMLVFKNGKHLYYANDYALHHSSKSKKELKKWYTDRAKSIMFTDEELMSGIKSYDEYERKENYIHNYWIQQFEHLSIFHIGNDKEYDKEKRKFSFYCSPCFCYVKDKEIVEQATKYKVHLSEEFPTLLRDEKLFRKMIATEMSNHEVVITGDYTESLSALGLCWKALTNIQKRIVNEEFKKQIAMPDF